MLIVFKYFGCFNYYSSNGYFAVWICGKHPIELKDIQLMVFLWLGNSGSSRAQEENPAFIEYKTLLNHC